MSSGVWRPLYSDQTWLRRITGEDWRRRFTKEIHFSLWAREWWREIGLISRLNLRSSNLDVPSPVSASARFFSRCPVSSQVISGPHELCINNRRRRHTVLRPLLCSSAPCNPVRFSSSKSRQQLVNHLFPDGESFLLFFLIFRFVCTNWLSNWPKTRQRALWKGKSASDSIQILLTRKFYFEGRFENQFETNWNSFWLNLVRNAEN